MAEPTSGSTPPDDGYVAALEEAWRTLDEAEVPDHLASEKSRIQDHIAALVGRAKEGR